MSRARGGRSPERRALRSRRRTPALIALLTMAIAAACGNQPASVGDRTAVTRSLGTWQGRDSQTVGIISESGRLRVTWEARAETPARDAHFHLALHSAVSGRPIQVLADQRGDGHGTVNVADDPRPYNFMIESHLTAWTFSVDEIVAATVTR